MNIPDQFLPSNFDTLITDITEATIKTDISQKLKKQYLAPLGQNQTQTQTLRTGIIYGASYRGLISIPTRYQNNKPIWIHYLIDTGSPKTFLSSEALRVLIGPNKEVMQHTVVFINGQKFLVGKSYPRFRCVNILGMDFIMGNKQLRFELAGMLKSKVSLQFQKC